jgi:hypothetical protein
LRLVTGLRAERYDPAGLGFYWGSIDGAAEDVEHFFAGVRILANQSSGRSPLGAIFYP